MSYLTKITDYNDFRSIMCAGNARIILEAPSGNSHTYAIQRPSNPSAFPDDVFFVYAVHEAKLFYVGMVEQSEFRTTRASRFLPDTDIVKGASYLSKIYNNSKLFDTTRMSVYHDGCCARCRRKLSGSFGLAHGLGKKCMARIKEIELSGYKSY